MKRRDFLRTTVPATLLPSILGGFSVRAFAESPLMQALSAATLNDHVLILVQLNGGNDGLNTVIPLDQYTNLAQARSNILIPDTQVLALNGNTATGFHPSMIGMQQLFNDGKLNVIQGVGYPSPNFSHFRSTDIWLSGSDSNQVLATGWGGRYLNYEYPNFPTGYPNATMPDPLAIQIGNSVSQVFWGVNGVLGYSLENTNSFYNTDRI